MALKKSTVSLCALLAACSPLFSGCTTTGTQTQPAQMKPGVAQQIFDTSELSDKVNACENLNTFMNAKWIAANPIPEERTRWGSFDLLIEKSLDEQHKLLQQAAHKAMDGNGDTIEDKVGRLYASGMDTQAIDAAGYTPIKPRLASVAAIHSRGGLKQYLTQAFAAGQGQVFELYAGPDYKNAKQVIA